MSRIASRLNKLDGGGQHCGFVMAYRSIQERPEWPNEVGDFIWSRVGVFFRESGERVDRFIERVHEANDPPRALRDMTEKELEKSLADWRALVEKMHPEFRLIAEKSSRSARLSGANQARKAM